MNGIRLFILGEEKGWTQFDAYRWKPNIIFNTRRDGKLFLRFPTWLIVTSIRVSDRWRSEIHLERSGPSDRIDRPLIIYQHGAWIKANTQLVECA